MIAFGRDNLRRGSVDDVAPSAPSPSARGDAAQWSGCRPCGVALVQAQPSPPRGPPVHDRRSFRMPQIGGSSLLPTPRNQPIAHLFGIRCICFVLLQQTFLRADTQHLHRQPAQTSP